MNLTEFLADLFVGAPAGARADIYTAANTLSAVCYAEPSLLDVAVKQTKPTGLGSTMSQRLYGGKKIKNVRLLSAIGKVSRFVAA